MTEPTPFVSMPLQIREAEEALADAVLEFLPRLERTETVGLPSCDEAAHRALVNRDQHDSGCLLRQLIYRGQRVQKLRQEQAVNVALVEHPFEHLVGD